MQTLKEFRLQEHCGHISVQESNVADVDFTIDYCMNTRSLYEGLCEVAKLLASPSRSKSCRSKTVGHTEKVLRKAHILWGKEPESEGATNRIRWDYPHALPTVIKFIIENPDRFGVTI
jgi:hypothetical protein